MSTVSHSVPSRFAVLSAELYGREDDTLIAWQRTCTQISDVLQAHHAGERLSKALALAQAGTVKIEADGYAVVASGNAHYQVQADGRCNCPDYSKRGGPCKHALAVLIHSRALELLEPNTPAPAAPTSPGRRAPLPTSAAWQVHEAQTSACVKMRIGSMEITYTIRGTSDAEVLDRLDATLQRLRDTCEVHDLRAAERAAARTAVLARPTALAAPAAPAPTDVHALVQHAVQQALAAQSTGQAASRDAGPPHSIPYCSEHGPMRESTKAPGTWFCTQKLANGAYCTSKA